MNEPIKGWVEFYPPGCSTPRERETIFAGSLVRLANKQGPVLVVECLTEQGSIASCVWYGDDGSFRYEKIAVAALTVVTQGSES